MRVERHASPRQEVVDRLSWQDLANLVIEAEDTPMHMAVLATVEGDTPEHDGEGAGLLEDARAYVSARLDRLPEFRRVLYQAASPAGGPVWVDDADFDIERHVLTARVPDPGGEAELLATTERLLERLLDRAYPVWEIWVLTGLGRGGFALLLKVHHAVTDGLGMLRIADVLFEKQADRAAPEPSRWAPSPPPSWARLSASVAAGVGQDIWSGVTALTHPARLAASTFGLMTTLGSVTGRTWTGRRARLRRPIGARRTLAVLRLELEEVKRVAHAHGAKVNDVVLVLAAAAVGGLASSRGEDLEDVVLRALVAVNPPSTIAPQRHNRAGSVVVSLPVGRPGGPGRLEMIALDSRRARRWQRAGTVERFMVLASRTRLARFLSRHQGAIDLAVSNLRGPDVPIYFVGRRLVDVVPITPISGNVTIDFCALSYAGRFNITLLADAGSWPDLGAAVLAMRSAWNDLKPTVRAFARASS